MINGFSLMGANHQKQGKNNQDAYQIGTWNNSYILVVADGVGDQPYSHIGSHLTARQPIREYYICNTYDLDYVESHIINMMYHVAPYFFDPIHSFLLSTLLVAVIHPLDDTFIYGIGDGFYSINDTLYKLDNGNTPESLSYNLLGNPSSLKIHKVVPTKDVTSVSIATDGLRFWDTNKQFPLGNDYLPSYLDSLNANEDLENIVRRANVQSRNKPRVFEDDITIAWWIK